MSGPAESPGTARALKLLHLYRRGVGGERQNAGRQLAALLREHDLTLYDLDPSLPVSQDLTALEEWRESASLLTRLRRSESGQAPLAPEEASELLTRLVDAPDLTAPELRWLLERVDLAKLLDLRADGWAYAHGGAAQDYRTHGAGLGPADLLAPELPPGAASLAERLRAATERRREEARHAAFPERLIRTEGGVTAHFVLGLAAGLGAQARLDPGGAGVYARLSADQLARLRTLLTHHQAGAEAAAQAAAEAYGRSLV